MASNTVKVVSRSELIGLRRQLGAQGARVVFTNGCFDLLHRGHVEYLAEARELGDVLVVGINSDASVRALKGEGRPFMPQQDRAAIVAALEAVSYVCIFDEVSVEGLIAEVMPDILVKGGDYRIDEVVGGKIVERAGGEVRALCLHPGLATTTLIDRIKNA